MFITSVVLAVTATLTGVGPAVAEPSPTGCAKGDFCAWWKSADTPFIHRPDNFNQIMMAGTGGHI